MKFPFRRAAAEDAGSKGGPGVSPLQDGAAGAEDDASSSLSEPMLAAADAMSEQEKLLAFYGASCRTCLYASGGVAQYYEAQLIEHTPYWRVLDVLVWAEDDLDNPGQTVPMRRQNVHKDNVLFPEVVEILSRFERTRNTLNEQRIGPTAENMGLEHYKALARMEGFVFDREGKPCQMTADGHILGEGEFSATEIAKTRKAMDAAHLSPPLVPMQPGVLREEFAAVSARYARGLDEALNRLDALATLDKFYDKIGCIVQKSSHLVREIKESSTVLLKSKVDFLPQPAKMEEIFAEMDKKGIHSQPFRKFYGETELATRLFVARALMTAATHQTGGELSESVAHVREAVTAAEKKLRELGGTDSDVARIKGRVFAEAEPRPNPEIALNLNRFRRAREQFVVYVKTQEKLRAASPETSSVASSLPKSGGSPPAP